VSIKHPEPRFICTLHGIQIKNSLQAEKVFFANNSVVDKSRDK